MHVDDCFKFKRHARKIMIIILFTRSDAGDIKKVCRGQKVKVCDIFKITYGGDVSFRTFLLFHEKLTSHVREKASFQERSFATFRVVARGTSIKRA